MTVNMPNLRQRSSSNSVPCGTNTSQGTRMTPWNPLQHFWLERIRSPSGRDRQQTLAARSDFCPSHPSSFKSLLVSERRQRERERGGEREEGGRKREREREGVGGGGSIQRFTWRVSHHGPTRRSDFARWRRGARSKISAAE